MTTEDDFQRALDARPQDWQTRLVFADWLDERDDPRAEGYRAMGFLRRFPSGSGDGQDCWWWRGAENTPRGYHNRLPLDWYDLLPLPETRPLVESWMWPLHANKKPRREVEDAAALAFAKLPRRRRMQLLSLEPAGAR